MISAGISDPFRREPDRTDVRSLVTVSVSVDILPEYAEKVLVALVHAAHDQMLRAVEPPF